MIYKNSASKKKKSVFKIYSNFKKLLNNFFFNKTPISHPDKNPKLFEITFTKKKSFQPTKRNDKFQKALIINIKSKRNAFPAPKNTIGLSKNKNK